MSFSIDPCGRRTGLPFRRCRAAWQTASPLKMSSKRCANRRRKIRNHPGPKSVGVQMVTMEADMPTEFDPNRDPNLAPNATGLDTREPVAARGGNGGLIAGIIVVLIVVVGIFALRGNFSQMEGRSVSTAPSVSAPATAPVAPSAPATPAPAPAPAPAAPTAPANR
jgi:hypothetical protein